MSQPTSSRLLWGQIIACAIFFGFVGSGFALDLRDQYENRQSFFGGGSLMAPIVAQGLFAALFLYATVRCIRLLRAKEYQVLRGGFGLFCIIVWVVPCMISIGGIPSYWPKPNEDWTFYDDNSGEEVNLAVGFVRTLGLTVTSLCGASCAILLRFRRPQVET